ncbi:G-protein coupled receptor [Elysia marginata]|uniref:G-protein coupled receptor n=1 Tax=Elysia marginata TaxID=1093978 RepID=A0AAV4EVI7_9GAST|nr:G-protein coupled receptor [Elysia marginata]
MELLTPNSTASTANTGDIHFPLDAERLLKSANSNCSTNCTHSIQENIYGVNTFCSRGYFADVDSCPTPSRQELRNIRGLCSAVVVQNNIILYVALALGVPGSVFTLITVSSLKYSPAMVYLGSLAASDLLALFVSSLAYHRTVAKAYLTDREVLTMYIARIFQALSHWILALICLERFITVRFPMHKSRFYRRRTVFLSLLIALILSIIPFPVTYVSRFHYYNTIGTLESAQTYLYQAAYLFVPGLSILILTVLTGLQLKAMKKRRRSMISANSASPSHSAAMETKLIQIMWLTVACFFVLACPFGCMQCFDRIRLRTLKLIFCPIRGMIYDSVLYTFYAVSLLNHAVNFYIYCACGKGFRKQFIHIVSCRKIGAKNVSRSG